MIRYLDPTGEPTTNVVNYDLRADLSKSPLRVGLFSNAFPDVERFRDILATRLAERLPNADIPVWDKPGTETYSEEQLGELGRCDALALLWGH